MLTPFVPTRITARRPQEQFCFERLCQSSIEMPNTVVLSVLKVTLLCLLLMASVQSSDSIEISNASIKNKARKLDVIPKHRSIDFHVNCTCSYENISVPTANCSRRYLYTVPKCPSRLSNRITVLDLSYNQIQVIRNDSFSSYGQLEHLNLSYNHINYLEPWAFRSLDNLQTLLLDGFASGRSFFRPPVPEQLFVPLIRLRTISISHMPNRYFPHDSFLKAMCNISSSLLHLKMERFRGNNRGTGQWILNGAFSACFRHTRLRYLNLNNNMIAALQGNALAFPYLIELHLRRNHIFGYSQAVFEVLLMRNITLIDFGCQVPWHCRKPNIDITSDSYRYYQPGLPVQTGTSNQIANVDPASLRNDSLINNIPLLPALNKRIHVEGLKRLKVLIGDHYFGTGFEVDFNKNDWCFDEMPLEVIDMEKTALSILNGTFPCARSLRYVNLRGINLRFLDYKVLWESLNVETILLGGSVPKSFFEDKRSSLFFSKTKKIKLIDLSYSNIRTLPVQLFGGLHDLQYLDLGGNQLSTINFSIRDAKYLRFLDLRNNNLKSVPEKLLWELKRFAHMQSRPHVLNIDLSGNPLFCSCYTQLSFKKLLELDVRLSGLHGIKPTSNTLKCTIDNGTVLTLPRALKLLKANCNRLHWMKVTFGMYMLALSLILGVNVAYRKRYTLMYLWHRWCRYLMLRKQGQFEDKQYQFDAFVAYCSKDDWWLLKQLLPRLGRDDAEQLTHEDGEQVSYQFCFDLKDFLGGVPIMENILHCISISRHTILFVTKRFVKSGWCQTETLLAHAHFIDKGRQGLIAVVHYKVLQMKRDGLISPVLASLFDTVTYIEWPKEHLKRQMFWIKLQKALGKPLRFQPIEMTVI